MPLSEMFQKRLVIPEWFLKKTFGEIKQMHREGALLASLKKDFGNQEDSLLALHYKKEKHDRHGGVSSLVLDFEWMSAFGNYKKEVIFQYRYDDHHWGEGAIKYWVYPDDVAIPYLSDFLKSPQSLKKRDWNRSLEALLPSDENITIERFHYSPALRVSYLLSLQSTGKKSVLKIVRREDFDPVLKKAEAIVKNPISKEVILPSLLAYSQEHSAFLFNYLPGLQLKKIKGKAFTEIKAFLFHEIVRILTLVHQTSIPEVPVWDPVQKEINRLCSLLRPFRLDDRPSYQQAASLVRAIIAPFSQKMQEMVAPYHTLIHNTLSMKHLLYQAGGSRPETPERLGILDWDSIVLGPPERDIAQILSDLPDQGNDRLDFLNCYRAKSGYDLNLKWIETFTLYRRLIKKLMKGLRQDDLNDDFLNGLKHICEAIEKNAK